MKKKIENIIKEIVRNEAITSDELKMLAKKEGLNKNRITYVMRQAGIIKILGKGVYQVLRNGHAIDDFVTLATSIMERDIAKRSQKKDVDKTYIPLLDDPNTPARAEAEIDLNARILEMMNAHMDKVQINTNKQNEYMAVLAMRLEKLEKRIQKLEQFDYSEQGMNAVHDRIDVLENNVKALQDIYAGHKAEIKNNINDGVIEDLRKRVEFLELTELTDYSKEIVHHSDQIRGIYLELATLRSQLKEQADKLAAMQVRLDAQLTHIYEHRGNGNVLRALHQILGEVI
jgi:hypothetical protein